MSTTVAKAVLGCRCPRCRKGKMFSNKAYNLTKFDKMYERCSVCNFRFEIEPGFFIGAMYVSYAMTVALVMLLGGVFFLFLTADLYVLLLTITVVCLSLLPLLFRYSRVLYLYLFGSVSYEAKYGDKA